PVVIQDERWRADSADTIRKRFRATVVARWALGCVSLRASRRAKQPTRKRREKSRDAGLRDFSAGRRTVQADGSAGGCAFIFMVRGFEENIFCDARAVDQREGRCLPERMEGRDSVSRSGARRPDFCN